MNRWGFLISLTISTDVIRSHSHHEDFEMVIISIKKKIIIIRNMNVRE